MFNAIGFDYFRTKKKSNVAFIIPAVQFKNTQTVYQKQVTEQPTPVVNEPEPNLPTEEKTVNEPKIANVQTGLTENVTENKQIVSKFSLLGLKKKKEADLQQKERNNLSTDGPVKPIEYSKLVFYWNEFAKQLNQNGEKIMYTYMVLDTPKLENNTVLLNFPNQSSKDDFIKRQASLIAYLREKLENVEITVAITISEEIKQKFAFTPEEKFEKLKGINPAIDLMRKLFDLELN